MFCVNDGKSCGVDGWGNIYQKIVLAVNNVFQDYKTTLLESTTLIGPYFRNILTSYAKPIRYHRNMRLIPAQRIEKHDGRVFLYRGGEGNDNNDILTLSSLKLPPSSDFWSLSVKPSQPLRNSVKKDEVKLLEVHGRHVIYSNGNLFLKEIV